MKTVNWTMQERFIFDTSLPSPKSVEKLQITPRFTEEDVQGRPKITGIYHLAVTLRLNDKLNEQLLENDEVILIDSLDVQNDHAYFEYAVPFQIDLPPEATQPVSVDVANMVSTVQEDGVVNTEWEVRCTYAVAGIEKQAKNNEDHTSNNEEIVFNDIEVQNQHQAMLVSHQDEILGFVQQLKDGISRKNFSR